MKMKYNETKKALLAGLLSSLLLLGAAARLPGDEARSGLKVSPSSGIALADINGKTWFGPTAKSEPLTVMFAGGNSFPLQAGEPETFVYLQDAPGLFDPDSQDREYVLPAQAIHFGSHDLSVQRKIYVPVDDAFCRWLNIFTNTASETVTFTVIIGQDRDGDAAGIIVDSSDGNAQVEKTDTWVTTLAAEESLPYTGHVLQGKGEKPAAFLPAGDGFPTWFYTVTLAPGASGIIATFATSQPNAAAAASESARLLADSASAFRCMDQGELRQLLNLCPSYYIEVKTVKGGHTDRDGWNSVLIADPQFTVTAFPDPGYGWGGWTGHAYGMDNPLSLTVSSDMVIIPVFSNLPPTVSITSPAGGSTLKGTSPVTCTASDDHGVAKVDFVIDGITKASASAPPYVYSWNTVSNACGSHVVKAVAYDLPGLTAVHEVTVNIENVTLSIAATRITERKWLARRQVVKLEVRIENPYAAPIAKYAIQRKTNDAFVTVKEIAATAVSSNAFTWSDTKTEKGKTSIYRAVAFDAASNALGISPEKSI